MDSPSTLPFEIVLDSGAVDHVADNHDAPGYAIDAKSKTTASFAAANGEPIENEGEMTLNLTTTTGHPHKVQVSGLRSVTTLLVRGKEL